MATKTTTTLVDDIDGSEASTTITFGLEGANYSIDLNEQNAKSLRDALKPYVKAARPAVARRSSGTRNSKTELAEARAWLHAHGKEVRDRGRIPAELMEEFRNSK